MGVPGPSIGGFLRGRASRREYWVFIGVLFAIAATLSFLAPGATSSGGTAVVLYAQVRRLHDLGRSGWWAAGILGLQVAAAVGVIVAFGVQAEDAALVLAGILTLAPIVILGAIAGQPFENRFGPAPGQRALKDIFG